MNEPTLRLWELRDKINDPSLDPTHVTNVTDVRVHRGGWCTVNVHTEGGVAASAHNTAYDENARLKVKINQLERELIAANAATDHLLKTEPALS
jgi:hypothetical protein